MNRGMVIVAGCFTAVFVGACWSGEEPGSDGGLAEFANQDCTELPASQEASEPCCFRLGADACGADLFCAAFDDRTVPTCYVEGSRADGDTCSEPRHCLSGACHDTGLCKATPGAVCTLALGCGPALTGDSMVCQRQPDGVQRCVPGTGGTGEACGVDEDCNSGRCTDSRCSCVPDCSGRVCGPNGCGGSCGECDSGACDGAGQCVCTGSQTLCGTECVNTAFDPDHCGGCFRYCDARGTGAGCFDSVCRVNRASSPGQRISCAAVCSNYGFSCLSGRAIYEDIDDSGFHLDCFGSQRVFDIECAAVPEPTYDDPDPQVYGSCVFDFDFVGCVCM